MNKSNGSVYIVSAITAAIIFFNPPAYASDDESIYIGGSLGSAESASFCKGTNDPFTCNNADSAKKLIIGFQSNRWFAIELGYIDLGKFAISTSGAATGLLCNPGCTFLSGTYSYSDTVKNRGYQFMGIGSIPLGKKLSLLGKLGWLHWTMNESSQFSSAGFPIGTTNIYATNGLGGHPLNNSNISDTGDSVMLGFGLKYEIKENFIVRGEFEAPTQAGPYKYKILSTSLIYVF